MSLGVFLTLEVLLVRHAKSFYDWAKYPTDAERPLSEKGRKRQIKVAKGMKKSHLTFDLAWVSPYRRAQETLEIIQETMHASVPIKVVNELIPGGDEEEVFNLLQDQVLSTPKLRLLLVSHNPLISTLVELLASSNITLDMSTSDVAHCEITEKESRLIKYYSRDDLMVD